MILNRVTAVSHSLFMFSETIITFGCNIVTVEILATLRSWSEVKKSENKVAGDYVFNKYVWKDHVGLDSAQI